MTKTQRIKGLLNDIRGRIYNTEEIYQLIINENIKDIEALSLLFNNPMINRQISHLTVPSMLLDFIYSLLNVDKIGDVLVPWSDIGVLPMYISQKMFPTSLTIFEKNAKHAEFIKKISENEIVIECGEPIELVQNTERQFDFIFV